METIQRYTYYRGGGFTIEIIPQPPDSEKATQVLVRWVFTEWSQCLCCDKCSSLTVPASNK